MRKRILLLIIFIVFPLISADGVSVVISPSSPSLDLKHGEPRNIKFNIDNDQRICSLRCSWELYDQSNNKEIEGGGFETNKGNSIDKTLTFTAPSRKKANQDSGTITYRFTVDCKEVAYGIFCNGKAQDKDDAIITLNYDLSEEDKRKRDEVKRLLKSYKPKLENLERKHADIEAKLESQPRNFLGDKIQIDLNACRNSYLEIKQWYDLANKQQLELDYTLASNNLRNIENDWERKMENDYNNVKVKLDNQIKRHNGIVQEIKDLSIIINEVINIANSTNNNANSLDTKFNDLRNDFNNGKFNAYGPMSVSISSLNQEANNLKLSFERDLSNTISEGLRLVKNEKSKSIQYKLLTGNVVSNPDNTNLNTLKDICEDLSGIKKEKNKINQDKYNKYEQDRIKVNLENNKINRANAEIKKANALSKTMDKLVNEEGRNEVNSEHCRVSLMNFASSIKYDKNTKFEDTACSKLKEDLEEEKSKKETNFFTIILMFFKNLFKADQVDFKTANLIKLESSLQPLSYVDVSSETKSYLTDKCDINIEDYQPPEIKEADIKDKKVDVESKVMAFKEKENKCCVFGKCETCCEGNECSNDEGSYPIVFLHGHSFKSWDSPEYSLDAFNKIQDKLVSEGFRNGGMIIPNTPKTRFKEGEWGKVKVPMTIKTTYYYDVYSSEGKLLRSPSKYDSINTYAKRLNDIIETVKYRTGRNKVNIIAHSMGGLVAREYIKEYNGDSSVNKLIMIGTPNHGIYGSVGSGCPILGAPVECNEMKSDSSFISSLNSGDETYGNVKYYTIAGSGCLLSNIDEDGIVRVSSAQLNGANNVKVNGKCEGTWNRDFHSNLLNPSKYPKTYEYIKQFLKE